MFSQLSSSTKSASFRELQLRAYTLPAFLAESCGVQGVPPFSRSPLTWPSGSLPRVHSLQFCTSRTCKGCRGKRDHLASRGRGDFLTGGWEEVAKVYKQTKWSGESRALCPAFPGNSDYGWSPPQLGLRSHSHLVLHKQWQTQVLGIPSLWRQLGSVR